MDTTTIRQIAQIEAIGLLLAVILTFPIVRRVPVDMRKFPAWPLLAACIFGIAWFGGLYVSTGQDSRLIPRAALVAPLAFSLFSAVNLSALWYLLLLKSCIRIEPRRPQQTQPPARPAEPRTGAGAMGD